MPPEDPHHALNNPARDPDPTEWPDPYETRPDPRDPDDPVPNAGNAPSTSEPSPDQDPQALPPHGGRGEKGTATT
jgi:hypothetical protein